jgi:MoaA/NifB/PqqE/SkfB family radical SAM enzyme
MLLTNRCNSNCSYCNIPNRKHDELDLKQVISIIDGLVEEGTFRIGFYGGEALIRPDIDKIVGYAKQSGLVTHIYTNGKLVKEKLDILKQVDGVFISLDGPKTVHDKLRGSGSYDHVIEAMHAMKESGIPFYLMTVVTNSNASYLHYVSNLAKEFDCPLNFQIVTQISELSADVSEHALGREKLHTVLDEILALKKENKKIVNSNTYLKRLKKREHNYHRTGYQQGIVKCWNGRASCQIDADGSLHSCLGLLGKEGSLNLKEHSVKEAFHFLEDCKCEECEHACSVEYNLWLSLNPESVFNVLCYYVTSILFSGTRK